MKNGPTGPLRRSGGHRVWTPTHLCCSAYTRHGPPLQAPVAGGAFASGPVASVPLCRTDVRRMSDAAECDFIRLPRKVHPIVGLFECPAQRGAATPPGHGGIRQSGKKTGRIERTIRTSGRGGLLAAMAALPALATDDTFIVPAATLGSLPSASDGAHGKEFVKINAVAQQFQRLGGASHCGTLIAAHPSPAPVPPKSPAPTRHGPPAE